MHVLYALAFFIPLALCLQKIVTGAFPFWYDIARDFLAASDNLVKPTLLGPPSGIPGIFYGPYWIWLLSGAIFISKDPRIVTILVGIMPYFILFPILLFGFRSLFPTKILVMLWFLFSIAFSQYATNLWNPHIAPLLFLLLFSVVLQKKAIASSLLGGLLCGLITNFHMSFGIGVTIGTLAFLVFLYARKSIGKGVLLGILFLMGLLIAYIPFLLFEYRHGFAQIASFLHTMREAVLYNSVVVGQRGLTKEAIVENFFAPISSLEQVPRFIGFAIYGAIIGYIICLKRSLLYRVSFSQKEQTLLWYLLFLTASILLVYVSSKNPVWEYHFIGVEILLLFSLAILLKKSPFAEKLFSFWVFVIGVLTISRFVLGFTLDTRTLPSSFASEVSIIEAVYKDANGKPFAVFEQSPSIYTYEFDYLFAALAKTNHLPLPITNLDTATYVYIILPDSLSKEHAGFVASKTPSATYYTLKYWQALDKSAIYKQAKKQTK